MLVLCLIVLIQCSKLVEAGRLGARARRPTVASHPSSARCSLTDGEGDVWLAARFDETATVSLEKRR